MSNEAVISNRAVSMSAPASRSERTVKNLAVELNIQKHVSLPYREFEQHTRKLLTADAWSPQRISNIVSALRGWMRALKFDADELIGDEFGSRFAESFRRYEDLIAEQLAVRTQKDRQEQLQKLKQLYDAVSINDLLPPVFGEALAYAV